MTTINLKRYYPYMTENMTMEVSDEIAAVLSMGGRLCDSYKRQKRRNGECSLDTDPGFEADVLHGPMTPDEYMDKQERDLALYDALAQLPPVQARRIYQHYILGKSKAEIAAADDDGLYFFHFTHCVTSFRYGFSPQYYMVKIRYIRVFILFFV